MYMPMINDYALYNQALQMLKSSYGNGSDFREGQYEAIEATFKKKRTLVVQKTGWGKSLVYFISTKLLRNDGKGVTLVISPLLALMDNQVEAGNRFGLNCKVLNSSVKDKPSENIFDRTSLIESLKNDEIDLLLITPETILDEKIQKELLNIKIGLLVVDEVHCISDWGHDFRLKYGQLNKIIQEMLSNVPVLATTATANNRVVADLTKQLGNDVYISRGPLTRKGLAIQVLRLQNKAERYAWLLDHLNELSGTGIIYCLTRMDCTYLSEFLNQYGIKALPYFSGLDEDENAAALEAFKNNEIKVLVATVKLGMGYDKGDISFVIHFQQPSNIVSYYQQIGRAGRNTDQSYALLMTGQEDEEIINYFINTAFPEENIQNGIIDMLSKDAGLFQAQMFNKLNFPEKQIKKALYFLENDGFVFCDNGRYYLSTKKYVYDREHYEAITNIRLAEKEQMKTVVQTKGCYSKYIVNCLDDDEAEDCGVCANCIGHDIIEASFFESSLEKASDFINSRFLVIEPRKQWPNKYIVVDEYKIPPEYRNKEGFCLSRYGDSGFGEMVKQDKYHGDKFNEKLVVKGRNTIMEAVKKYGVHTITCVPSNRNKRVHDYAKRLAAACQIDFLELFDKADAPPQKLMENSAHQCANAFKSVSVKECVDIPQSVVLVDDIVDSRWTLTVCGYILLKRGCQTVVPLALADSSNSED